MPRSPQAAATAARADRVPGRGEGARAGAAAQGEARRRPARPRERRRDVEGPPPRCCGRRAAPARARARVLVQRMARGHRGAGRRGRSTRRSAPASRCGPAARWPRPATRRSSRRPSRAPRRCAFVRAQAEPMRARRAAGTTWRATRARWRRSRARPTISAAGSRRSRRTRCSVAAGAARSPCDRAGAKPRAAGVIYGLVAALGLGLADFGGAIAGRRIGSLWAVIARPGALRRRDDRRLRWRRTRRCRRWPRSSVFVVAERRSAPRSRTRRTTARWSSGPVAVVSPIGAAYAVVGVLLAVVFLGERPGVLALVGSDRDGRRRDARLDRPPRAPGRHRTASRAVCPWAIVSAVAFGVGGVPAGLPLAGGRVGRRALGVAGGAGGLLHPARVHRQRSSSRIRLPAGGSRVRARRRRSRTSSGVIGLSVGAERGLRLGDARRERACSRSSPWSLSLLILHERLVPNQYAGIALVVVGLLLLGA